jgi:hypothetical protein
MLFRIENDQRSYLNSINKIRFLTKEFHEDIFSTCLAWEAIDQPLEEALPTLWE